jgi:hypothetical protein
LTGLKDWCQSTRIGVKSHTLFELVANSATLDVGVAHVAGIIPNHYASPSRVADILTRLGKPAAAAYLATKLPTSARSRSGDTGEILASSWVGEFTEFNVAIQKLRWKDSREMAMRGDDILGVCLDRIVGIRFLKGEVKSRATLAKTTVTEAREALLANDERPTPHALAFVSDRLNEGGETALSSLIDKYQLTARIETKQLSHLMFMFAGNSARKLLEDDLIGYTGSVKQFAVGLQVATHQDFIKRVFLSATEHGDDT